VGAEILLLALCQAAQGSGAGAPQDALRTVLDSGAPERCFDVLFVGDGYQAADLAEGRYGKDVDRVVEQLLGTAPFSWYRKSLNVRALALESRDAGCDLGPKDEVHTALDCAFDGRKKEILHFRNHEELLRRVTAAGAVDCVFVLVNTPKRGAAASTLLTGETPPRSLPAPTLSGKDPASFGLAMHGLGHSLGGLNDEFTGSSSFCPDFDDSGLPPGGPNVKSVTTGTAAEARDDLPWEHFRALAGGKKHDWMHEGAGRREKNAYRPWRTCRMRDPDAPFCPVCTEELAKVLQRACAQPWNDEEYHRAHPLELWKK
jgi:IgA peptidase M64